MKHIAHTGETTAAEGTDDDKSVQLKPIKPKSKSEMDEFVGPDNIRVCIVNIIIAHYIVCSFII